LLHSWGSLIFPTILFVLGLTHYSKSFCLNWIFKTFSVLSLKYDQDLRDPPRAGKKSFLWKLRFDLFDPISIGSYYAEEWLVLLFCFFIGREILQFARKWEIRIETNLFCIFQFFSSLFVFLSLFVQESGSGIGGYYSYWLRSSTNKTWNRKEKEDRLQCSHSRNKTDRETKDNVSVNIISIGHPQIKIDVRCCTCR
jgi:hypothetical protein